MKLLRAVVGKPELYIDDAKLEHALRTQKGIARYENHERGIGGSSLNTVRRLCERGYGRIAFQDFDLLRVRACNALLRHRGAIEAENEAVKGKTPRKLDSRDSMRLHISSLKVERVAAVESAIHSSMAFMEALRICRDLANYVADVERLNAWRKEEKELLAMFSLRKQFDDGR